MDPLTHYNSVGKAQGRLWTCGKNMTMLEAEEFLWKNSSMQHGAGGSYGSAYYQIAANYFKTYSHKYHLDGERQSGEEPWLCQDGTNTGLYDYKAECTCYGTLWVGLGQRPDNGQAITSFNEMRQWQTDLYAINGTMDVTSMFHLKSGLWPDLTKRMYCERKNAFKFSTCANEGEDCFCPAKSGVVFG